MEKKSKSKCKHRIRDPGEVPILGNWGGGGKSDRGDPPQKKKNPSAPAPPLGPPRPSPPARPLTGLASRITVAERSGASLRGSRCARRGGVGRAAGRGVRRIAFGGRFPFPMGAGSARMGGQPGRRPPPSLRPAAPTTGPPDFRPALSQSAPAPGARPRKRAPEAPPLPVSAGQSQPADCLGTPGSGAWGKARGVWFKGPRESF